MLPNLTIDIAKIVGGGYGKFWHNRKRYLVNKGGRASKKSTTAALRLIWNIMKYPESNALVLRQVFDTHRTSTYAQLKWAINRLGVGAYWKETLSPLELVYLPTGQKIIFKGLDDPDKITSITVDKGYLCWIWFEEAFQVYDEQVFNKIDLSLRGQMPEHLWKEITLTLNPWSSTHWIKKRFYDTPDDNVCALTTSYLCNEFLDDVDRAIFDKMRRTNKRRFYIEGLGEWGLSDGLVYTNFVVQNFSRLEILQRRDRKGRPYALHRVGLDFGFTNSPTAIVDMLINELEKEIYICREHYQRGMTNKMIAAQLHNMELDKSRIKADSAEPKSIEEIRTDDKYPVPLIKGCKKGGDGKRAGIQKIQDYRIIIHPECYNFQIEINNYVWDKTKEGLVLNEPIKDFDHGMDGMRYGMEDVGKSTFKFLK